MAKASNETGTAKNVIALFPTPRRADGATPAELAEYRRIKPLLLQMLREWEAIKSSGGCPIARNITSQIE